jgi:hypothetical protein
LVWGRGGGAGRSFGGADDAEDFGFGDGGAGDEDAEAISVEVGGGELDAAVEDVEQLVGGDAFEDVTVAEGEFEPEALDFRAAEEGFAFGQVGLVEVCDEIDRFDGRGGDGLVLAVGGEEVEGVAGAHDGGAHIALSYSGVEEEDHYLFVCRG